MRHRKGSNLLRFDAEEVYRKHMVKEVQDVRK